MEKEMDNKREADKEKETDKEEYSRKFIILFGLFNIALVLILSRLRIFLISVAMVLLLGGGIYCSVDAYKEGKRFYGVVGFLLHLIAILIYVGEFGMIIFQYIRMFLGFFN